MEMNTSKHVQVKYYFYMCLVSCASYKLRKTRTDPNSKRGCLRSRSSVLQLQFQTVRAGPAKGDGPLAARPLAWRPSRRFRRGLENRGQTKQDARKRGSYRGKKMEKLEKQWQKDGSGKEHSQV